MQRRVAILACAGLGGLCVGLLLYGLGAAQAPQIQPPQGKTYFPVVEQDFAKVRADDQAAKPTVMQRQEALLAERYDLSNRPAPGVMMSGGRKAVQQGARVKLPAGLTWERLAAMSPDEIRDKNLFPQGVLAAAARQAIGRWHDLSEVRDHGDQQAGSAVARTVRRRVRSAGPSAAGVSATRVPDDPAGAGRWHARAAPHDQELRRDPARHPDAGPDGRHAPAAHAVPPAAVQPDRRPQDRRREPRRHVSRLSLQRPHQRRLPPDPGHSPAGGALPDRNGEPARDVQSADPRLQALAEDRKSTRLNSS